MPEEREMVKYRVLLMLAVVVGILTACAGAAAPVEVQSPVGQTVVVTSVVEYEDETEDVAPVVEVEGETQTEENVPAMATGAPVADALQSAGEAPPAPGTTGGDSEPNDEPYGDTFYQNYGVNPFIDSAEDPLSTFGVDVDTGSYTIMRRYLNDGYLPPADAVRVEEYINFFDQGYAPPTNSAFRIIMDGAPSPFGENDRYYLLRVGLKGREISTWERKDANLVFVVDVSGSMDMENRLGTVKEALRLLVPQLRPTDRVAIVVYGDRGEVLLEPTSGENQRQIMTAIDGLIPQGSTNAEEGLSLGYDIANRMFDPNKINAVILCSDGVANVGNTGPESILRTIQENAERGISLNSIGFGMGNYNDVLMEQLANDGDGRYYYVDTLQEAERVFVENLSGTLQVIAYDAKIQVEFDPAVVDRYRLIGYENRDVADEDFRNDTVDAGEIGAGHSVTALYEVRLVEGAEGSLATARLRYQDADMNQVVEIQQGLPLQELSATFAAADPYLQLDAMVAEYAEILRDSYWARENSLGAVRQYAAEYFAPLKQNEEVAEFLALLDRAVQLESGGQ
jgi:Ca-activated chloride channel family protein